MNNNDGIEYRILINAILLKCVVSKLCIFLINWTKELCIFTLLKCVAIELFTLLKCVVNECVTPLKRNV